MINEHDGITIDMWGKRRFTPLKFQADAYFYPHGSFGCSYRGNIYDERGIVIGDYAANSSTVIEEHFLLEWNG